MSSHRSHARSLSVLVLALAATSVACSASNAKSDPGTLDASTPTTDTGGATADTSGPGFEIGGDDSSTFNPDAVCAAKEFGGKRIPLALALVFDQSSSMSEGSPSKMSVAKSGVKKALSDPKFDDVAVGLFRFGYNSGFSGCVWDVNPTAAPVPLGTGRDELFSNIDKLSPSGATPTYDALNAAYGWLAPKILAKSVPENGKVAVVLVTDGAPTCGKNTIDDYVALVEKARKATIDTFFIGLPGTDEAFDSSDPSSASAASFMSKCAARGTDEINLPPGCDKDPSPMSAIPSKPCYFDFHSAFTVDALASALDNIRKSISSCEYVMPSGDATYDATRPGVYVTDAKGARKELPHCTSSTDFGPDGCWDWSDATHTHITIFGAGCTTVKTQDGAKVDLLLPCKVK